MVFQLNDLLVVNYHGSLHSYVIIRNNGFKLHHSFVVNQQYPLGVGSVVYHENHKLLFVGACGQTGNQNESVSLATKEFITAWRILSDNPHYKLVTQFDDGLQVKEESVDYGPMECTNCLSHSGKLSLWDVPSLRQRRAWRLEDQPDYQDIAENQERRIKLKDLIPHKKLLDVNFWSNETLITARCTGAVTVSSVNTLKNLQGKFPEWFEPSPRVIQTHDEGFTGIECEVQFPSRSLVATNDQQLYDCDVEQGSWITRTTRFTKLVLYYLTDSEKFQPPRKKPKLVTRLY